MDNTNFEKSNENYEQENQRLFMDAFGAFYEVAFEVIYDEYVKRCDGIIDCVIDDEKGVDETENYHKRLNNLLDLLSVEATKLREKIFDTTKH